MDALERTNRMNLLYDFYAPLLTGKQQQYLQYYFHENYSLAEIAELSGVSRQAVNDQIRRAGAMLEEYEDKLHLLAQHEKRAECLRRMENAVSTLSADRRAELERLLAELWKI